MPTLSTVTESVFSIPTGLLLIVVLIFLLLVLFGLSIVVFQLKTKVRGLTYPVYDQVIKEAQKKADQLLKDVQEQARAIRTKAEMEAGQVLVDRKKEATLLKEEYIKQLEGVTMEGKEALGRQIADAGRMSGEIVGALKQHVESTTTSLDGEIELMKKSFADGRANIQKEFAELSSSAKADHKALLEEHKKNITETLSNEIASVRQAISEYKKERFAIVDQQVVGLIEDTTRIALNRSLSLQEHTDIIQASLEEAKKQGIFSQ
jgi:F0F1-type ATP synthase membrane subunit b/b'